MPTTPEAEALVEYLYPLLSQYVEDLRELCAIECPTSSKKGVDEAGAWVERWSQQQGWEVRRWPDKIFGDSLVVTARGTGEPHILLASHLDTVYPVGTAAERPLLAEGDRLVGPGCADNKSGLLSGLYAMAAVQDLGWLESFGAISLVCGSDEEKEMRCSAALLQQLASSSHLALVLEAGRENGDIVTARKGSGSFSLEVTGKAAHAGVEPHKGANAILCLAHQIIALQALNGMREGVTLNVGVVRGGTQSNVVPDHARIEIDVRVARPEDMEPVGEAIASIGARPVIPDVSAALGGGWQFLPMARTPRIGALAALANSCAAELDFSVEEAATGGISYANLLASLGLPVLDGLGPVGGLNHSPQEYITIPSIVTRTALLALLMLRWQEKRGR